MEDHDQRFKELLQEFFADFLQLFFKPWAERFDTATVEWLDKEVFPDPPEGQRRVLDLVGKLPTRVPVPGPRPGQPEQLLALIHVEIEAPDSVAPLRGRMHRAYTHLRDKHELPVLPIALYLRVGLDGIGIDGYEEHFWELLALRFQYLYVGLPALNAVEYLEGENWLGVALAALMKIPREKAAWLGAEALRRIQQAPLSDQRRFLLAECVQAYLPLDEAQQREFEQMLSSEPYEGVRSMNVTVYEKGLAKGREEGMAMNTTVYEKGLAKGREEGRAAGHHEGRQSERREILRDLLRERFGPLSASNQARLEELPAEQLGTLIKAVLRATSLADLGLDD